MANNKTKKSQRVSVSKRKLNKTADAIEGAAVKAAIAGQREAVHGAERYHQSRG